MYIGNDSGFSMCSVCGELTSLARPCKCMIELNDMDMQPKKGFTDNDIAKKLLAEREEKLRMDKVYDRIMEEQGAREYLEEKLTAKASDECPGRSQVKCKKCGKCHSVFKDCDGIGDFPVVTPSDKPSLSDGGIGTPDDYDWFGYYDEQEVEAVCNIDVGKNEGIRELYDELGNLSWDSDDEGWNEAIAAVRLAIKDIIQGGTDGL